MFDGFIQLSTLGYVAVTLVLTHITIVGVTVFLHRAQAHRALDLHPIASHFFRFWLWLTTGIITKHWVAIHRKHHAKVETDEDPHSPQVHGIWNLVFRGVSYYRQEAGMQETIERYGHATPDDWLEHHVYTPLTRWGYLFLLAVEFACFGWRAFPMWLIQMAWIPFWAAGVINGIGHFWGYRNFETDGPDTSRNILPWGIIIGGEELHNNHHAYSSSAKLSAKWYEFDVGWMYIQILSFFGLATVKRTMPELPAVSEVAEGSESALAGVRVLMRHHIAVLDRYRSTVLNPVFDNTLSQVSTGSLRRSFKRAKSWLDKRASLLCDHKRAKLDQVLEQSDALKEVYDLKNRLFDIYQSTHQTMDELHQALVAWCDQAMATDIPSLHDYAAWLQSYMAVESASTSAS